MADLSDVENAIKTILVNALYPNGTGSASALGSGVNCYVMRGWPVPADLDGKLAAGAFTVSVFSMSGMDRNTTRFPTDINTLDIPAATVTASISGQQITFGGSVAAAQNVGIIIGDYAPTQKTYVYAATTGDTASTIAAGLAALLVAAGIAATASGAALTLPDTVIGSIKVGVFGTTWQELRRQEKGVMVTVWCPTPDLRDKGAPIIDLALLQNERFKLADGSSAKMVYQRTIVSDDKQTTEIYRRDLVYMVEYPTTIIGSAPTIIASQSTLTAS